MSNTNNMRHRKHPAYEATIHQDLLPLSPTDAISKRGTVCATVRLYLAVWDDLTPEQISLVTGHIQMCERCAHEQQLFLHVTRSMTHLPVTQPSARIDRVVLEAIAARSQANVHVGGGIRKDEQFAASFRNRPRTLSHSLLDFRRRSTRVAALVALCLLVLFSSAYFLMYRMGQVPSLQSQKATLALPANLSWDKYVLYREQTMTNERGQSYLMMSYLNMSTESANIEVVIPGKIDIVVVKDTQKSLGLDMMHQVAQWGAPSWIQSDTSMFDLDRLLKDLQTGQATYLGQVVSNGQSVYRVRVPNGHILLLDMSYMPVNVLESGDSTGTGKPMYNTLRWLPPSRVPSSMWDMTVPANFSMGVLPSEP